MINMRAAMAMDILDRPRRFSADDFTHLAVEREFNEKTAASGILSKWCAQKMIVVVGTKRCKTTKGKDLFVYEVNESHRHELRRIVSRARKAPVREKLVLSKFLPPDGESAADNIQAWLDGITRARLAV